ncbi:TGS domain-containing protein [Candidatus Lokiarchaeum ossiferum]|uniref:TGS domain-containing protein n=1 Tax=Candidatus Lokiarchaeum ossiferum TaxID=2951803 RepID=UPI00352E14C1
MSSNLTLEAKLAYQRYLYANGIDARIQYLQEFLSEVPKHKATEKIVALNKTKLSKLKAEKETIELRKKALSAGSEDPFAVKREPHTIQVMMISDLMDKGQGVGKSTLLKNLTGESSVKPGIYTPEPKVGIYDWEHVKFQVIEMPSLQNSLNLSKILASIRNTDILTILLDLSQNPLVQFNNIVSLLTDHNIFLNRAPPNIKIERTGSGGIQLFFHSKEAKKSENMSEFILEMVKAYGLQNATIKIYEEVTVETLEMAFNRKSVYKPAIILATKADVANTKKNYELFKKKASSVISTPFEILPVAVIYSSTGEQIRKGMDHFGEKILQHLNLMRVYTKSKKGVAEKPLVVPYESTIGDVALKIHKDLYHAFKFAYVYRVKGNHSTTRIRTGLNFLVQEDDVIEIFSRF